MHSFVYISQKINNDLLNVSRFFFYYYFLLPKLTFAWQDLQALFSIFSFETDSMSEMSAKHIHHGGGYYQQLLQTYSILYFFRNTWSRLATVCMDNNYYPGFVLQVVHQEINNIPKRKIKIVGSVVLCSFISFMSICLT